MRQPKPFFRKQTQSWYVQLNGRQINLGKDKAEAFKQYHALMAGRQPATPALPVVELIDRFLSNLKQTAKAENTYKWYARYLDRGKKGFSKWLEDRFNGRLTIGDLTAQHVDDWLLERYRKCGDNTRNGAVRAIARVCNWARKRKIIAASPIAEIERPAYQPREVYLEPEDWQRLVNTIKPGAFLDIVTFLRLTGCRPHEACIAEVKHFDKATRCLVFERINSKGKKSRRVIQLGTGEAFRLVQRLVLKHGQGPIFRTRNGNPWTNSSLNTQCDYWQKKTGISFFPYLLRHSFITDALVKGIDPVTVAELVGHRDLKMIHSVYAHLQLKGKHLSDALDRINGAA